MNLKAQEAIIGKARPSPERGNGLVLVQVTLQHGKVPGMVRESVPGGAWIGAWPGTDPAR